MANIMEYKNNWTVPRICLVNQLNRLNYSGQILEVLEMFRGLMRDKVTVKIKDGKIFTDVAASVQRGKIFTARADIPICPGDQISRRTEAGVEEVFIVEDPGFYSAVGGIPAHYQMSVRRGDAMAATRQATPTQETFYAKSLRLLQLIYERTIGKGEPIFVEDIRSEIGLSEEDAKAAWRYLRDKSLIDTFSIQYTARINAPGIDIIETARSRPDEPAEHFPSVTYNYIIVQNMIGSSIQQGSAHAAMTQKKET